MNKLIGIAAVAVVLAATGAHAQTTTDAPPPKAPPEIQADAPPSPPMPGGSKDESRMMPRGPGMRHGSPPPPPSKAAHFQISDGNVKIDIKCAEDEPMKACADILTQILDRIGSSSED